MSKRARTRAAPVDPRVAELYRAKLASSGLTEIDGEALGLRPLDARGTAQLAPTYEAQPSLLIPYYDLDGSPLLDVPRAPTPFHRIRYLGSSTSFKAQARDQRYAQPKDTATCAYLPRTWSWDDLAPDVSVDVLITEGELKAAAATIAGFPTIGLGGVWNFRAVRHGHYFLPQLEAIDWCRRKVFVVFDSDLASNANVAAALRELVRELELRGALVHVVWLPEVLGAGEKVGLDDFLVFHGEAGPAELRLVLAQADLIGLSRALFDLNERFVYVANPGLLIDRENDAKHKPSALKEHLAAPTTIAVKELLPNGDVKHKRASAGAEWLRWPLRTSVGSITYEPGADRFIGSRPRRYNSWGGWGCVPRPGDVAPFLELVDHVFTGAEPFAKRWFLRWLAYPLRYPGTKLYSCVVVHGRRHGTGKSLLGATMSRIYGDNYTEIKQGNLHESHNEWAQNKQFILGDDVTGSNKREDNDVLKKLITQPKVRINPKYVPSFEIPDCINYLFTSNHPDSFFLEDDDRRFFVHEVIVPPREEGWYVDYVLWLDTGGAAAIFDYLLQLDLEDFNAAGRAPMTAAKQRMIADVKSDLGSWVRQLLDDPDSVLRMGEVVSRRQLLTSRELLGFYDPAGKTGTTANGLTRELRRAGAIAVADGQPVKTSQGQARYFAVRHGDRWADASRQEVTDQLEAELRSPIAARATKF